MKRLVLFLILAISGLTSLAQHQHRRPLRYDHSNSFFSLNFGATHHTSDVNSDLLMWRAGGVTWGRSYFYRPGSPVFFDLRGRFMLGTWEGLDRQLSGVSASDNVFNGTNNPALNYYALDSTVLRNFRNHQALLNAELVMHFNRLREATRWDLYVFGGVGLTMWRSRGNYLNSDGDMYDYSQLNGDFSQSNIQSFLDNSFETPHEGSSSTANVNWMPSVGIGIGRQLGSRLTVGIEHKTTFSRTDLWDGLSKENPGSAVGSNDLFHYTGLYMRWYMRGFRNNQQFVNQPNQPQCFFPQVVFTEPMHNHHSSMMQTVLVRADIRNLNNRNQITFRVNGQFNNNFNYNPNSGVFQSQVLLNPGQNFIEITASNNCGSVTDNRIIVFQQTFTPNNPQPQMPPPIVSISNPFFSPHTVEEPTFNIQAQVLNVSAREQIQMTVNGQVFNNFNFNSQSAQLNANVNLSLGNNTITITASNQAGFDSDETIVIYNRPTQLPAPVVQFVAPTASTIQINTPTSTVSANVFHVSKKQDITVFLNGVALNQNQFNFNTTSFELTFTASLLPGANTIQIVGANSVGTDQKEITIIYRQVAQIPAPIVNFIDPAVNPYNTIQSSHKVSAVVQHVANESDIQVWLNNNVVSDFSFNTASNLVEFVTGLQIGSNIVRIKATNASGYDDESTVIVYTQHNPVLPPVVTINSPMGSPALVLESSVAVKATVLNVESASGIQVLVNNQSVSNFIFDAVSHQLDFVAGLNTGSNTIVVRATNAQGQAEDMKLVNYTPQAQLEAPVVTFINPSEAGQVANISSFEMTASVKNVVSKENIQVHMNGQPVASYLWNWNASTATVSYHTSLIQGLNLFTVTGSNAVGVDSKTLNVNYQAPSEPCNAPSIVLNKPAANNVTLQDSISDFEATTNHIKNPNQIKVSLNGVIVHGWTFNDTTNKVSGRLDLILGNNTVEILVNNGCDKDRVMFNVVYQPVEVCNAPILNLVSPQSAIVQTQDSQISVKASSIFVNAASEVKFKVNGSETTFKFDPITQMLSADASLIMGSNSLSFEALNTCGQASVKWNVLRVACEKPEINLSSNVSNGSTVNSPEFNLIGTIVNVADNASIKVTLNGQPMNFVYDEVSDQFNMSFGLKLGANTIVVSATNTCGVETLTMQVNYERVAIPNPPVVDINNPEVSPYTTTSATIPIEAEVLHVTGPSQITAKVNGQNVQFNFNPTTHMVTWVQTLVEGQNTIVVTATNSDGQSSDTKLVVYNKPVIVNQPAVIFTNPLVPLHTVDSQNFVFTGYITELSGANQASAKLNGQDLLNFNAQMIDGKLHFSVPVVLDNNHASYKLEMRGQNSAGVAVGVREVHRLIASIDNTESCLPVVGAVFSNNNRSVTASSTKDLSNVVLRFHDNTTQKFEGLSGLSSTFQGTGANQDKCIVGVWIKSGCNKSNDGPGFGEWVPNNLFNGTCITSTSCGVNFNPGSVEWQFCLTTNQSTFNSSNLNSNPNFAYQGAARSLYFVPVVNGEVQVNGVPYQVLANNFYHFEGDLDVTIKRENGAWNVCLKASALPLFGIQNRPKSPCEVASQPDTAPIDDDTPQPNCNPVIKTTFTAGQRTVIVNSSLNLNNVVLKFHDNTTQQFNNLNGKSRTLSGTGIHGGKCIVGVWVKSGCNSSNDGPNYGEYIENTNYNNECGSTAACGPFFSLRNSSWEFCMQTPNGTFNRDALANNSNLTYQGAASSVYFYAVNGGGSVTVNGKPFAIQPNRYYLFTGNIQVSLTRNDPAAPGQWMICITTDKAPLSGVGNQRPQSPCEQAGRGQGPENPSPRPNNAPQNKPDSNPGGGTRNNSGDGRTNAPSGELNNQPGTGRQGGNSTGTDPNSTVAPGGTRRP
jgi:large repetitive protein